MKKSTIVKSYLLPMIFLASMLGCSSGPEPNVTIQLNLGRLSSGQNIHYNKSLIDRFLRFFTTEANAQTAPDGITSIDLTISGPGMSTFTGTYAPDTTTIILAVEAGPARVFQVTAYRPAGNYSGSYTTDLAVGAMQVIPITMVAQAPPQDANVTINPTFPLGALAASSVTYTLNVTAGAEVLLSETYTPDTPIQVVQVAPGTGRNFTVTAETPSVTFTGSVLTDLADGATVTLTPAMTLSATKLVIPDYGNQRIVQIDDDFDTLSWLEAASPLDSRYLYPYDIDYDSQGRFYIANFGSADGAILRIDDILDTTVDSVVTVMEPSALAIDRTRNLLYYATSFQLYRINFDGTNLKSDFDMGTGISSIYGLDITDSGILLIAHSTYFTAYDPNANSGNGAVINSLNYNQGSGAGCWDIGVKGSQIYGARTVLYTNEDCIVEFYLNASNNLVQVTGGIYLNGGDISLYGPRRIIETMSDRLFFIDDDSSGSTLSVMDDITGSGRLDYGSAGTGTGQFTFF